MSTAFTAFYDVRDVLYQNQKNTERRIVGSSSLPKHNRNVNGLSLYTTDKLAAVMLSKLQQQNSPVLSSREQLLLEQLHQQELGLLAGRRLDRSMSEPVGESRAITNQQRNVNSSRYKTELCRPFEENGYCKYGDKCQFAHGAHELRSLLRHPKYKTELCRTFHTSGFCPYGPRCHFIHNEDERKLSQINQMKQSPSAVSPPTQVQRPRLSFNLPLVRESLGSTADSPPSSVTDSPSMSPTWLSEDYMGLRYSPPASAPASNLAFSFPADSLSPLNVDTLASLAAGLSSMSLSNSSSSSSASSTTSEVGLQQLRDALDVYSPPSPPDSLHSEPCTSPMDISRGFRLPIFSQLSTE